jgi:hypothetical protein
MTQVGLAAIWVARSAFALALKLAEVVDDHSGHVSQRRQPASITVYRTPVRRQTRRRA